LKLQLVQRSRKPSVCLMAWCAVLFFKLFLLTFHFLRNWKVSV